MKKTNLVLVGLLAGLFLKSATAGCDNNFSSQLYSIGQTKTSGLKSMSLSSQGGADLAFDEGKIVLTFGYGFGNLSASLWTVYDDELNFQSSVLGPIHFRGEYGLSEKVGIGLSVNHLSLSATWDDDYYPGIWWKLGFSSTSILARINFHFGVTEKLDPYFGIGAGYKINSWSLTSNDPTWVDDNNIKGLFPFGFEATIGLRYYFTPNIGLYTELGISKSIMQGGLAIAF